jgi:hypothetical protein
MYPAGVCESFPIDGMGLVVPQPRKKPEDDTEMMIYSSQIYLRVILNEAHNSLYGCKCSPKTIVSQINNSSSGQEQEF